MNVLIVDDIKLIGKSLKEGLCNLMPNSNINFFHYNVEICESENISMICEEVKHNEINILLLDRGYSKIYEDSEDEFVYSSISEADRNLRVRGEDLLCNNNGLLERLSNLDIKLSSILLYTYDIGDININNKIQNIKVDVQSKLTQLNFDNILFEVFETSTVFNKPTNSRIYPDSFYFNTKYKDSFIDYGKKKRKIGTKLAYKEYGQLMSHIIVDLIRQKGNNNIYDFSNPGNREFDIFLRSVSKIQLSDIQERLEYYVDISGNPAIKKADHAFIPIKLRPSTVSVIFNFQGTEKYYIDIPFKEYYDSLNDDIPEELIQLFKKKNGEYKKGQFVYYSYNYSSNLTAYELYSIKVSDGLAQEEELAKKWLPFLHCGLFHFNHPILWETPTILENNSYEGEKVGLFFFIDTIEIDEFKGHINFTFFEESDRKFDESDIKSSAKLILDNISPILKSKATDVLIPKLKDLLLFEATRAAISQVMARNTSHNIGAHVMNKLTNPDFLQNFCSYSNCLKSYKPDKDFEGSNSENHKPFNQLAIFNNYVKCRMDYLADISFGTPLMQTNKYVYGDLFMELDKVRLLLEHISGLDNFNFKIEFKRNGKDFEKDDKGNVLDDLLVAIPNDILGTQAFYNILENIIRNTAKHSNKETLGEKPVVFTVNFINDIEETEEYRLAINRDEIKNVLTEFIAVEVYDNVPVEGDEKELTTEQKKEYHHKMKKDLDKFASKIDALVFNQNSKLNEDILQKDNKIRSYSLGLVEMDASAAYLRKRPVEYINHKSYDIHYDEWWSRDTEVNEGDEGKRGTNCRHFLKAFKKTENGNSYLGYRFFLHRPAVVLVITDEVPKNKEELKKQGVWVVTKEEFEKNLKPENEKKDGKVYPHEFAVIDSSVTFDKVKVGIAEMGKEGKETERTKEVDFLEYYKTSLPIRVLTTISDLPELLTKSADEIEKRCWEEWVNKFEVLKNKTIEIATDYNSRVDFSIVFLDHLYSQKNNNATEYWNEHKNAYHCEALSTYSQQKLPAFTSKSISDGENKLKNYIKNIQNDIIRKCQLLEASISQVIVIDERIQEVAEKREYLKVSYKELYAKMHVIVPDKEKEKINLSENSFEKIKKDVENYIKGKVKEAKETDFILIHYSILERMYGKEEINSKLHNELIGESKINVVITSGRGTPDNLSEKVRFVNLSSVITAFVDVRSKYAINYLLNSSRKSNKI